MVAIIITTATTTTPAGEGKGKLMVMTPTLVFSDCLVATMAVTVGGGGDARLQERMVLVSGSLVLKTSWEEEEVTADVTLDTTRETVDSTRDSTNLPLLVVSVTTS